MIFRGYSGCGAFDCREFIVGEDDISRFSCRLGSFDPHCDPNVDDSDDTTISALIEKPPTVDPDATLDIVLDSSLDAGDSDGMPVIDSEGMLRGWLTLDAILRTVTTKG